MHVIRQHASSMLVGWGQVKNNIHACQKASRCLSDMNKLTLNDSPRMIRVTPLPKVFSPVAYAKSRETNALVSLENSSMEDSGVFVSMDRPPGTDKDVSECRNGNVEMSGRCVDDDMILSQVTQSDTNSNTCPCATVNKPQLPLGVIKVNGPPPLPKSAHYLPQGLLSKVAEFIQQNPDMAQNAVGQTSGTKRQCKFGLYQRKRKKAAQSHSKVVSEESDSALASSSQLSPSSSELGSVHSGDGYFWDSPFLSQSDNAHGEVEMKCVQHDRVHRDCEIDTSDTACVCVLCSAEKGRPMSGASSSGTASTVFGLGDVAVLFSNTDKSDVAGDACTKSCKKAGQQEKQAKQRKQKKKKKDNLHTETSAGIDGGETTSKKQPPNYFIAIQVANPEIHERLRTVQEDIVSSNEQLRAALVPLATLHLTLMVMRLPDSDEQLDRAKSALDSCGKKLKNLSNNKLDFSVQGLGQFRNNVIFAKVEDGPILHQLSHIAETVMTTFSDECGILPVDNKGFKPHITIMKLSRSPKLRKKGVHKIDPALYESHVEASFGRDCIRSIQLCSMFKSKDAKGYYHVVHAVPIRNYFTTATPPGGGVTHCRLGIKESQNEGIHNPGENGKHMVDEGTRGRGVGEGASVTFTEHLEIPMEWVFHAPDDG